MTSLFRVRILFLHLSLSRSDTPSVVSSGLSFMRYSIIRVCRSCLRSFGRLIVPRINAMKVASALKQCIRRQHFRRVRKRRSSNDIALRSSYTFPISLSLSHSGTLSVVSSGVAFMHYSICSLLCAQGVVTIPIGDVSRMVHLIAKRSKTLSKL